MSNTDRNHKIIKDMSLRLLSEGKSIRIKALGYSMFPSIKPGTLLIIEPLSLQRPPVPGEIVAIKRENGLIVHRLVNIITKNGVPWYIARGDSNPDRDHPVTIDRIVGRVVKAEPTGQNPVAADITISTKQNYIINRLRVLYILIKRKITVSLLTKKI
jgi:signal peptidase I